ncbi:unnamed protein product, partial [Didymodactylos carnosus]
YMLYKDQRIVKKRSTIKRSTHNPVFNECFTFSIPSNDIKNIRFELIIFDFDRHMKHEPIGKCDIGGEQRQHYDEKKLMSILSHQQFLKNLLNNILPIIFKRQIRTGGGADRRLTVEDFIIPEKQPTVLDRYANTFRREIESEQETLATLTSKNKSLQLNYELEKSRKQQATARFHMLKRKYFAHPNDVVVKQEVKNHIQFLHKNYPKRWDIDTLANGFGLSREDVQLGNVNFLRK